MIDHTGFNVSDLAVSKTFYSAVLAPLGMHILRDLGFATGYGRDADVAAEGDPGGSFWISAGKPQEPRVHLAFVADSHEAVRHFHAAALTHGGRDNGGPGYRERYHPHYYAAFVLDPDGYNVEAVCHRHRADITD
jgi:catechol 2,3-dioxygenase-like lactoylglutathione lyase family enzyme